MSGAAETLARYKGKFHDAVLAKAIEEGRKDEAVLRAAEIVKAGPNPGYARILAAGSGSQEPLNDKENDVLNAELFVSVMRLFMLDS